MADRDGGLGFSSGFVVGAAIGLAIGFLYSPRAGEETRELAREGAGKVRERTVEALARLEKTASEVMRMAQAKLEDLERVTERAAVAAQEAERTTADAMKRAQEKLEAQGEKQTG
jgi:gas vesicle protein